MSTPPDNKGLAAAFPTPVDESALQRLVRDVSNNNGPLTYRTSDGQYDVTHQVFRWNSTDYSIVFQNGFQARPQGDTPNGTYYSLEDHVNAAGAPLDPNRRVPHVFISTSLSTRWRPNPPARTIPQGGQLEVYRYQIYAPGGIWVSQTLGARYHFPSQDEVAFARGIARQYIHSAQLHIFTRGANGRVQGRRGNPPTLIYNEHFNPRSSLLTIQMPVLYYVPENGTDQQRLAVDTWPQGRRQRRDASDDWYTDGVEDSPGYINAAFRSTRENEAYLFMRNEYVLVNYAPGTTDDYIVNGPLLICDGYPSLSDTAFGEYGIDCAFDGHDGNKAFIFSGNLCAHIDYAPGTTNDKILNGPMTITAMFPFLNNTVFANSIDAAFASTVKHEAYLFKGDSYANINYDSKTCIAIRKITQGFYCLRDTIFQSGIEAAFASHRMETHWLSKDRGEAYLFKGDKYALINFAAGTTDDYIIGGVKPITDNFPSLRGILPRKNRRLDYHDHHNQEQDHRDYDDL